ncbi:MAG TPA: HAD-IIIC family phosphatase [Bryobacteraceae bacterium]|nr:HAD-IIIC family phosphatase [Bryobacteraceae bacterium]
MKLAEALKIGNAPQSGPEFTVLLACGFTPLHLESMAKAHLRLRLPDRSIRIKTGLYGDLPGTLEQPPGNLHGVLIALEWSDLDPRLGWRASSAINETITNDVQRRLGRIEAAIRQLATDRPVALSLPLAPLPPVFLTSTRELNPVEARLRELLYKLAAETPAVVINPQFAPPDGHDLRAELMNGFPFSIPQADQLASQLIDAAFPLAPRKGLITDLDETLWSGVLGDDGVNRIHWDLDHKSQFHALYQQFLNSLAESGTLVGVASKNDPDLVRQAFARTDLLVNHDSLFPIEAHWEPKAGSISRTLATWNIGAGDVVFVDDNDLERALIKETFPEMECVLFRRDDASVLRRLRDLFGKRQIREEDRLRSQSLREGQAVQAAAETNTLDTLLESAEAILTLSWAKFPPDPRALELVNKTNQFNLNGRRYTSAEWNQFMTGESSRLLVADYTDRFGKLGKISVLAGCAQGDTFNVTTWVLSCRAFSRRIEHQMLKSLFEHWKNLDFQFVPTERNGPTAAFLASIGANTAITRDQFAERCPPLFQKTVTL